MSKASLFTIGNSPVASSLSSDLKLQNDFKYSSELQIIVQTWIEKVLNIQGPPKNSSSTVFLGWLKSGEILCELFNKLFFLFNKSQLPIPKFHKQSKIKFHHIENLDKFLEACQKIGELRGSDLFDISDLFEEKNGQFVLKSLIGLGNRVKTLKGVMPDKFNFPDIENTSQYWNLWAESLVHDHEAVKREDSKVVNKEHKKLIDWINSVVESPKITNLSEDLKSGTVYLNLLSVLLNLQREQLIGGSMFYIDGTYLWQWIRNADVIIQLIDCIWEEARREDDLEELDVKARDIVEGRSESNAKLISFLRSKFDMNFLLENILTQLTDESPLKKKKKTEGKKSSRSSRRKPSTTPAPTDPPVRKKSRHSSGDTKLSDETRPEKIERKKRDKEKPLKSASEQPKRRISFGLRKAKKESSKHGVDPLAGSPLKKVKKERSEKKEKSDRAEKVYPTSEPVADQESSKANRGKAVVRKHVLVEILTTERTYVNALETVVKQFLEPIEKDKMLSNVEISNTFLNWKDLYNFHKSFLDKLEREIYSEFSRQRSVKNLKLSASTNETTLFYEAIDMDITKLCQIIKTEILDYSLQKLYSIYLVKYGYACMAVKYLIHKNDKFKNFIESAREKKQISLDLTSLLVMPIQRIPRYILLLDQISKFTVKENEKKIIENVVENLKKELKKLNESIDSVSIKEVQKLISIDGSINNLPFELVDQKRKSFGGFEVDKFDFVSFKLISSSVAGEHLLGTMKKEKDKKHWIYVFNDLIISCEKSDDNKKDSDNIEFNFKKMMKVDNVQYVLSDLENEKEFGILEKLNNGRATDILKKLKKRKIPKYLVICSDDDVVWILEFKKKDDKEKCSQLLKETKQGLIPAEPKNKK